MASVYLASSVGPGGFEKPCAVKRIRAEYSSLPSFRDMLIREARVAALLNHPNIVQVFDFGEVDGEYFLTMEWVDGLPLQRLIADAARRGATVELGAAIEILTNVARALQYVHSGFFVEGQNSNLVHRDVSPSNILLSTTGAVKLTDFGVVKVLEAPGGTEAGVVKGKYAYMSPEQLKGQPLDPRSDLFSFGVVTYELLTGRRLFRRADVASTVAAVLASKVPKPSSNQSGDPARARPDRRPRAGEEPRAALRERLGSPGRSRAARRGEGLGPRTAEAGRARSRSHARRRRQERSAPRRRRAQAAPPPSMSQTDVGHPPLDLHFDAPLASPPSMPWVAMTIVGISLVATAWFWLAVLS